MQDHQAEFTELDRKFRNGANWFYWIAGLSLINSVIVLFGGSWAFIFGLGTTQVVDAMAVAAVEEFPTSGWMIKGGAFMISLLLLGVAVVFGVLSNKGIAPVFIIGIVIYCVDGLLFLLALDVLGLAFHGLAIYQMIAGYQALVQLKGFLPGALDAAAAAPVAELSPGASAPPPVPGG